MTAAQRAAVRALLSLGVSVIVDDTNLLLKVARDWADLAEELGVSFSCLDFRTSLAECIANDYERGRLGGRTVGASVIHRMAQKYPIQGWKPVEPRAKLNIQPYQPRETLTPAWIFDIDGTLAHMRDRSPYDWKRVSEDAPDLSVLRVLWSLRHSNPGVKIIAVSGRDGSSLADTIRWLQRHHATPDLLLMRAPGDNRKDSLVKLELFNDHIRDRFNVRGVFDDRNSVVAMWRRLGLKTFQVAEGDF
ncbi:hypothetical protein Ntsu_65120 [Nocardia sp. IFM 10818]